MNKSAKTNSKSVIRKIFFSLILLLIVSGLLHPYFLNRISSSWKTEIGSKLSSIENETIINFQHKQERLIAKSINLKKILHSLLSPQNSSYQKLTNYLTQKSLKIYSIEIIAPNGKLIAWNNDLVIPTDEIFPLSFPVGETYFYNGDLASYLSIIDTLKIQTDQFYLSISIPLEKHYEVINEYFNSVNYSSELSEKFNTDIKIIYNPISNISADGRKYSFELLNNRKKRIGYATILKPTFNSQVYFINDLFLKIQSLIFVLAYLILGLYLKRDFSSLNNLILKITLLFFYLLGLRSIFYKLNIPSMFIHGDLTNPSYFSSTFGYGVVKSPLEFFTTNLFVIIFAYYIYTNLKKYYQTEFYSKAKIKTLNIIVSVLFVPLFFYFSRGLIASIRDIIFNSSIRYFKEPNLISSFVSLTMNLNTLMISISITLFLVCTVIIIIYLLRFYNILEGKAGFILLSVIFLILTVIYFKIQKNPLIPIYLWMVIVFAFVCVSFYIAKNKFDSNYYFLLIIFISSVISVTLLNYFNLDLERESIKTTALELNRPNDKFLELTISETLTKASQKEDVRNVFYQPNKNANAAAFIIWNSSPFKTESLISSIILFNKNKNIIGEFTTGKETTDIDAKKLLSKNPNNIYIEELENNEAEFRKVYAGVIPVYDRDIVIGYIFSKVKFDLNNYGNNYIPPFLVDYEDLNNAVIDIKQLNVFVFENGKLINAFGNIYPSRDQVKPILSTRFNEDNEAWIIMELNGEKYLSYLLKTEKDNGDYITAVLLKEKQFSWNLFNFFKLFILHFVLMFFLAAAIFIANRKKVVYTFRIQLLIAFLIIALVPLIILAFYNHQIVLSQTKSTIQAELSERVNYIENHINTQHNKYPDKPVEKLFENAGKELNIAFTVYKNTDLLFSSMEGFYKSGLLSHKLSPQIYYKLFYSSFREIFGNEQIENYTFNSFYKKININNNNYIIGVNDAFNDIKINLSVIEFDVYLFGVYSFAVFLIIIISTFLANKISEPIRKLTKATNSVALGDFNIELEVKEKGEIKDLVSGFNKMTKELQRTQFNLAQLERENAWKEMARQVAHEIKNPLTPMKLAVQQLVSFYKEKNRQFDDLFVKVTDTILKQIENLKSIASEFSNFARMPIYKFEKTNIINVLNDSKNLFLEEKIKISIDANQEVTLIDSDKTELMRIFINLIRNSIQAGAKNITFTVSDNEDFVSIIIEDDGDGIPDKIRSKIFSPNFTTKKQGMGLGLKMAKRYLEQINGKIDLGEKKNGAMFIIKIPKKNIF